MSSSLHLTKKLKSTQEIEEIVSSMKVFANYNVRSAKAKLPYLRSYQRSIEDSVGDIVTIFPHLTKIEQTFPQKTIFVLFLSEEGLCGFFNENILDFFSAIPKADHTTVIIGEMGAQEAKARKLLCRQYLKGASNVEAIDTYTVELSAYLHELVTKEHLNTLNLVYAKHNDQGGYDVVEKKILPPDFSRFYKESIKKEPLLYLESHEILNALIKEYLHTSCYRAFLESVASENQERFNSMNQAGNAIKERRQQIGLELNAFRQREITEELLEIVNTYRSMIKEE
ncbi:MAG: F0F1 ATP synthase subunit gamma [Thiovulaceae bacterium]|nr:F0F1 ATP synthase subunit gamma [Sulfurimonadaceae bacterium]